MRGVYRTWDRRLQGAGALLSALTWLIEIIHWLKYKLSYDVMYECSCNTMKSLKVIKITTFDQNQFMTCYLIFNFRPTYFSYFRKITVISISHNVKKLVDQKWSIPVVKGLIIQYTLIFQFEPYFIFVKYFRNKFL